MHFSDSGTNNFQQDKFPMQNENAYVGYYSSNIMQGGGWEEKKL